MCVTKPFWFSNVKTVPKRVHFISFSAKIPHLLLTDTNGVLSLTIGAVWGLFFLFFFFFYKHFFTYFRITATVVLRKKETIP